ncbi:MAG: hypothetical protein K9M75_05160 [Phycisphaerae bacterium]|nr:hypothetical protein [Phycisphaerae bacterium]
MDKFAIIIHALEVIPHESLQELAYVKEELQEKRLAKTVKAEITDDLQMEDQLVLTPDATALAYDIIHTFASVYKERGGRLGFSVRRLSKAKEELIENQLAMEIWSGKALFLAPTERLYSHLKMLSPYKRNVSLEHSFRSLLTEQLIKGYLHIHKTGIEVPVGTTGSTVDLVAYLKNGGRWAYEITLSSSNVTENAAKLRNKGFSKIIFVCRDDQLRRSVQTILRDAGFEPDFFATIECTIFSVLMKKHKRSTTKGK